MLSYDEVDDLVCTCLCMHCKWAERMSSAHDAAHLDIAHLKVRCSFYQVWLNPRIKCPNYEWARRW